MERTQCCRTCLAEADLRPLFASADHHDKYSQVVLEATGVHIIYNDRLPQQMCVACISSVNETYKFRKKCQDTQRALSATLQHSDPHPPIEQVFVKPDLLLHSIDISDLLETDTVINNSTEDDVDVLCEDNTDDLSKDNSTQEEKQINSKCINETLRKETDSIQTTVKVQKNHRKRKTKEESMDDILSEEINSTQTAKVERNHKKRKAKESIDEMLREENNLQHETSLVEKDLKKGKCKEKPVKRAVRPRLAKDQTDETTADSKKKTVKEKAVGERQQIECEQCHKVLTSRLSLRNHYKIHSGFDVVCEVRLLERQQIECEQCHKVLTSRLSLRNHYKIHSGFDVVCEHCGKKFITRRLLLMHCKAKHGYEKTDQCRHCPYRACNKEQVKIHERLHTGERPYACGVGECAASFTRRSSLLQHRASHLREKTVPCPQCGARFKSGTLMRIHQARHRAPRVEFSCGVCALRSMRRRNVARHLARAHALTAPHLIHRTQLRDS